MTTSDFFDNFSQNISATTKRDSQIETTSIAPYFYFKKIFLQFFPKINSFGLDEYLNGQNPLTGTKIFCRWPLRRVSQICLVSVKSNSQIRVGRLVGRHKNTSGFSKIVVKIWNSRKELTEDCSKGFIGSFMPDSESRVFLVFRLVGRFTLTKHICDNHHLIGYIGNACQKSWKTFAKFCLVW